MVQRGEHNEHFLHFLVVVTSTVFILTGFSFAPTVYAALTCTVSASCAGTTMFKISGTSNGHAGLTGNSSYTNLVCCSGVAGLGNACSGTFATLLKLSATNNAHVEQNTLSNYANSACISLTSGSIAIAYQANNCTGYDTTVASMSATTNAQVGDASAYVTKVCASAGTGTFSVSASSTNSFNTSLPALFVSQTSTMSNIGAMKVADDRAGQPGWTVAMTATDWAQLNNGGPGGHHNQLDYDGTGSDGNLGKMCPKPANGTLYAESGSITGVTKGSNQCFSAGVQTITIFSASAGAGRGTYWLTDMPVEQFIPSNPTAQIYTTTIVLTLS